MPKYKQRYSPWYSGTPINAVKASVELTVDVQVTADDTMTLGAKVYTFVADGAEAVDGDISVGTDLATGQANIVSAINGTDSINTAHPSVVAGAFATNVSTLTAIAVGTEGNSIASTSSFTTGTNQFASVTLLGGLYATQSALPCFIFNGNDVFFCDKSVSKWDESGWRKGTLATV